MMRQAITCQKPINSFICLDSREKDYQCRQFKDWIDRQFINA